MGAILKFILGLSPAVLAVASLFGGASLALAGFMAWNNLIDNPYIRNMATAAANDACTIRVMDAANRAEAAERARQQSVSNAALDAYNAALRAQEASRAGLQDTLETERQNYEHELEAAGRSCHLDSLDDDWLRKQSDARERSR